MAMDAVTRALTVDEARQPATRQQLLLEIAGLRREVYGLQKRAESAETALALRNAPCGLVQDIGGYRAACGALYPPQWYVNLPRFCGHCGRPLAKDHEAVLPAALDLQSQREPSP